MIVVIIALGIIALGIIAVAAIGIALIIIPLDIAIVIVIVIIGLPFGRDRLGLGEVPGAVRKPRERRRQAIPLSGTSWIPALFLGSLGSHHLTRPHGLYNIYPGIVGRRSVWEGGAGRYNHRGGRVGDAGACRAHQLRL